MESYEDDDDTHFCIKCHLTVHGLENYVRHRQSGCRPPDDKNVAVRVSPTTPTTVSYPEILNADAFFSSLELQSSSKSNPRRTTGLLEESRKFKKDDKRKKGQKPQVDAEESGGKEKLHGMLPGVSELEDPTEHLCMPPLVGFPDIVSSTASKPTVTASRTKLSQSMGQVSGNIESTSYPTKHETENSLETLMTSHAESKQTERKRQEDSQRIEQVHQTWLEDTILAELVANNENKDLARYEFEYQQEEDSEDDMLEEDLGEDDSYSESEDGEDQERPPHGHTGGKWKPGLEDLPQNMSQLQDDEAEAEDEQQEHPPPTYTGGKWRPTESSQKLEEYQAKDNAGQPPPGHTQGKWVPGARTDIESGYWCSPCGRKLASRLVYNRHLLSDLHARRSIREIDGVLCLPRTGSLHVAKKTSARNQKIRGILESKEAKKSLRRREKEIVCCETCHARVRRVQMGKHLLSHYHCRVAGVNPRGPRARRFLLENMANVVRQCPFQCSSCRFYCNTEETFLHHWRSELHAKILEQIGGNYKCNPCDFWCENNESMDSHLLSTSHRDVVSMMNGSLPVVVGRQRALSCGSCDRRFRYNLQLRLHVKETGHEGSMTASDAYQQRIRCNLCPQIVRSLVALQRHQLTCHPTKEEVKKEEEKEDHSSQSAPYFCSFCSMNFVTAQEAVLHRRTSSHKEIVKARKCNRDSSTSTIRECPHCAEKQTNLSEHKRHLLENHPELCHRCPKCGTLFALSQDVTRHTRENKCRVDKELNETKATLIKNEWRCGSCSFSTNSRAEFIFHEALHSGMVENEQDDPNCSKSVAKYSCPVCKKSFTKVSLRNHIRSHTGERPFPCAKCHASFSRRADLNAHQKECTGSTSSDWSDESGRKRSFVCSECNDAFYTRHALRQHMLRHAGKKYKCGLPGCPTVLRTASELRSHRNLVHHSTPSDRQYKCSDCSYAAKTKTQLRRHRSRHEDPTSGMKSELRSCPYAGCAFKTKIASHLQRHVRLHTGTKPYKCRHCAYASNNLENLRKHVLSTSLHPGKTIYECDVCKRENVEPFRTNFAKELRAHLQEAHNDDFPTPNHANDYVLGIFEVHRSSASNDEST
ncbi:zinc finger protein 808 [Osmia bicornis bicornis]|uniref:zinc finger protein 808 n=1 Tax=Osmia bicornis bicornis TaxID=1437191 RepID=UPI001EAEC4A0|nr:zinc finger protein 808 [Osmia bicornis bicornis]